MADERSTRLTHDRDASQKAYDWSYYKALMPHIAGKVLDIGSGIGMFANEYADTPEVESVLCLDKFDASQLPHPKVSYRRWSNPKPLPTGDFDTVVSTEFIEHIERDQLEPLLAQITGRFVGSTPNKVVPTTNPYHLYEYTLDELKTILQQHFTSVKIWDTGHYCTVWVAEK